jgi:hypothetical protein
MIFPNKYNLYIFKGATLDYLFIWKDEAGALVNLTGYTARMHMREKVESSAPFMSFNTADSSIVLGGAAGTIQIKASAAATSAVTVKEGVYDLELVAPTGDVVRFLEGLVMISEEVTR